MPRFAILLHLLALATAVLMAPAAFADESDGHVVGWVQIAPLADKPGHVSIAGHALGLGTAAGTFKLAITRAGKSGRSTTSQAGSFALKAGEDQRLSVTAINVVAGETLEAVLTLSVAGKDVSVVTVRSGGGEAGKEI